MSRTTPRLPFALAAIAAGLWLLEPWWRPAVLPAPPGRALLIAVLIDDPERTETALEQWQRRPQAELWLLGGPRLQEAAADQQRLHGLPLGEMKEAVALEPGRNTVEQLQALAFALEASPPQELLLITDSRHLPRALAIARILLGSLGIRVSGLASSSTTEVNDVRFGRPTALLPESPWRLFRDQIRAQFCRTVLGCLPR